MRKVSSDRSSYVRRTCPRCTATLEIDVRKPEKYVECQACWTEYSLQTLERVSCLNTDLKEIGDYRLVKYLGSGRFADVWEAVDINSDQSVALKLPQRESVEQRTLLDREARVSSRMNHPNIVRSHKVVNLEKRTFGVYDLVSGVALRAWLRHWSPSPQEALQLCATLAEAMDHAHQQGIVHRDLKPSNILMDQQRTPFITDFGLAQWTADSALTSLERYQRALRSLSSHDESLGVIGTLAYMSPEQALGNGQSPGHLSDVYALGVILYELLTGIRPYRGPTVQEVRRRIISKSPTRPRRIRKSIPLEHERICLTAMAKNANQRYETAGALAEECRQVLNQPQQTHVPTRSMWDRFKVWTRRP